MAFDFLGTIRSLDDFEEFVEFVETEVPKIDKRIDHMEEEKNRLNEILDKYKNADLDLRSIYPKSKQADENYIKKPRPIEKFRYNNIDAVTAVEVDEMKKMFLGTIKYRRERNEFKIKKIRYLIEKLDKDISFLQEMKEEYLDSISRIRTRFESEDFPEVQTVDEIDSADVTPGIKVFTPNQGTETLNGEKFYLVLSMNSSRKTISFDTQAPPVKAGDKLTLTNGQNNGIVTVSKAIDKLTIEVLENIVDETDSQTKVKI